MVGYLSVFEKPCRSAQIRAKRGGSEDADAEQSGNGDQRHGQMGTCPHERRMFALRLEVETQRRIDRSPPPDLAPPLRSAALHDLHGRPDEGDGGDVDPTRTGLTRFPHIGLDRHRAHDDQAEGA